jgi:hypothetical protein
VIVGGVCRGWSRAVTHAGLYAKAYALAGLPTVLIFGAIWGDTEYGNFTIVFVFIHFLSVMVVWPAAIVANFAALRLFRPRSWRQERWRGWVAGSLGVPFCRGGLALWPQIQSASPEPLRHLADQGNLPYFLSVLVFFSNLAVLIGWILPPWKRPGSSEGG